MNILVGYDGSEEAVAAIQLAERHAIARRAKLHIVKTIPSKRDMSYRDVQKVEAELERDVREFLQSESLDHETYVVFSRESPGVALVNFAEQNQIDEIFIGVGDTSRAGKLLFGSTAQYVVLNSPCPVATVKSPGG